jgi:hypothetical protein
MGGNAYRRIGVRACRRLHTASKLTSASGSRFNFCIRNGETYWRLGQRRLKHTHAISGPDARFEQEGESTRPRNVSVSPHARPSRETNQKRLAYAGTPIRPTPTRSPPPQRPHAETRTRRHVPLPPNADTPTRSPSPTPIRFSFPP